MLAANTQSPPRIGDVLHRISSYVRSRLPAGHVLPKDVWEHQHRAILVLLWLHAIGIICYGLIATSSIWTSVLEGSPVAIAALLAGVVRGSRRLRAALATLGLLTSSAVLVHLSGGFVEMHFHFLMMMVIVALYQDWVPFVLAIGYVVSEYVAVGALSPTEFFGRAGSGAEPWQWLLVHVAFVLAACIAGLVHWRLDETAHARAEEARSRLANEQTARVQAEQAIRARDDLVSEISHDLKNPLGAVKGYAQLLRRRIPSSGTCDAARTLEGLEKIDATASKMTAVIDELLDLVRLELGESLDLDRQPVDLVTLAGRVAAEHQRSTDHHRIVVEARVPTLVGQWDQARLERALSNLVANAVKYSPGGDIRVAVARDETLPNRWAVVAVRDQGIGIPIDALPCIFDRFHRVGANAAGRVEGQGIGLASTRAIVEQHGGKVSVESTEGVGSTFTIRVPV